LHPRQVCISTVRHMGHSSLSLLTKSCFEHMTPLTALICVFLLEETLFCKMKTEQKTKGGSRRGREMSRLGGACLDCYVVLTLLALASCFFYLGYVQYTQGNKVVSQRAIYMVGDMLWCFVSHFASPMRFDEQQCGLGDDRMDFHYDNCCRLAAQRKAPPLSDGWWLVNPLLDGLPGLPTWIVDVFCWPLDGLFG